MSIRFFQRFPTLQTELTPIGQASIYTHGAKRVVDICLTVLALPFVVPLVLVMAFLVSLDGHGAFYTQERIGRHGKRFRILKLRTMVACADKLLEAHLKTDVRAAAEWEATQKLVDDPRVTSIGCYLRKFSLDEFPQLWNVLKGDMSLVGPRPMMTEQQSLYPGTAYFQHRPGITGNWQVSRRNAARFADRAEYDNQYAASLSFYGDMKLMLATAGVVCKGTGY